MYTGRIVPVNDIDQMVCSGRILPFERAFPLPKRGGRELALVTRLLSAQAFSEAMTQLGYDLSVALCEPPAIGALPCVIASDAAQADCIRASSPVPITVVFNGGLWVVKPESPRAHRPGARVSVFLTGTDANLLSFNAEVLVAHQNPGMALPSAYELRLSDGQFARVGMEQIAGVSPVELFNKGA